jgi:hypothetical protein
MQVKNLFLIMTTVIILMSLFISIDAQDDLIDSVMLFQEGEMCNEELHCVDGLECVYNICTPIIDSGNDIGAVFAPGDNTVVDNNMIYLVIAITAIVVAGGYFYFKKK